MQDERDGARERPFRLGSLPAGLWPGWKGAWRKLVLELFGQPPPDLIYLGPESIRMILRVGVTAGLHGDDQEDNPRQDHDHW